MEIIHRKTTDLTTKQKIILDMYLNKCSGAKIGRDLHMSRNTVYTEIKFLIENEIFKISNCFPA